MSQQTKGKQSKTKDNFPSIKAGPVLQTREGEIEEGFIGTDLEMLVMNWLEKHNVIYEFQTSLIGGFYELGGAVVDFIIPDKMLAWRVMGEYWHEGVDAKSRDIMQREILASLGFIVVDLWGNDLEQRLNETLRKALQGEEMLK